MSQSILTKMITQSTQVNCMKRITRILIVALVAFSMPAIAADNTDVVTIVNGDRLTGEVKSVKRGRLR